MASPTPQSRKHKKDAFKRSYQPASTGLTEAVDPVWLAKAIGITIAAALVCGYLTLCLLFYQGQWQLVLHPLRDCPAPSSIDGAPVEVVHFAVDESAVPQLVGWWLPSASASHYNAFTVLYMPGGDGSLVDSTATLATLHSLGLNVFAFDYRGFGQSEPVRPNERRMLEDATSAFQFLTGSRGLLAARIVLFGSGVGCALATQIASAHSDIPAVILESPEPGLIRVVLADPRTKALPVRTLFHERFDILGPVATLKTPKLLLLTSDQPGAKLEPSAANRLPPAPSSDVNSVAAAAATPKMITMLSRSEFDGAIYREQVRRFLDQYLH